MITPDNIKELKENEIFVFGSNREGLHNGGSAKLALDKFGAIYRQGNGLQGKSYAINSMSGLKYLQIGVGEFIEFAKNNPNLHFLVTEIGCGIAGLKIYQVAPFFYPCLKLSNVSLPKRFIDFLTLND